VERDEIEHIAEGKVKVAIAHLRAEILPKLATIEQRIIGIDGNGTGRAGVIQLLERKVDNIDGKVDLLLSKDSETKGALGQRQRFTGGLWVISGILGSICSVILGEYIKHKTGW